MVFLLASSPSWLNTPGGCTPLSSLSKFTDVIAGSLQAEQAVSWHVWNNLNEAISITHILQNTAVDACFAEIFIKHRERLSLTVTAHQSTFTGKLTKNLFRWNICHLSVSMHSISFCTLFFFFALKIYSWQVRKNHFRQWKEHQTNNDCHYNIHLLQHSPLTLNILMSAVWFTGLLACWGQAAGLYAEPNDTLSGAECLLDKMPGHRVGAICLWMNAQQSGAVWAKSGSPTVQSGVIPLQTDPSHSPAPSMHPCQTKDPA